MSLPTHNTHSTVRLLTPHKFLFVMAALCFCGLSRYFVEMNNFQIHIEREKTKGVEMVEELDGFKADAAAKEEGMNGIIADLDAKLATLSETNDGLAKETDRLREQTEALESEAEKLRTVASEDDEFLSGASLLSNTVYMHVGPHKTGSTTVQTASVSQLGAIRPLLSFLGPYGRHSAKNAANSAFNLQGRKYALQTVSSNKHYWEKSLKNMKNTNQSLLLASEELDAPSVDIEYLVNSTNGLNVTIIVANRDIWDQCYSIYVEVTRQMGHDRPRFDTWLPDHITTCQSMSSAVVRNRYSRFFRNTVSYEYTDFKRLWCEIIPEATRECARSQEKIEVHNGDATPKNKCIRDEDLQLRMYQSLKNEGKNFTDLIHWMGCKD